MSAQAGEGPASQLIRQGQQIEDLLNVVIPMGVAMIGQRDLNCLLELILLGAKRVCQADGGTLYMLAEDRLNFAIIVNDTLDIRMGGTSGAKLNFAALPLYHPDTGEPNHRNVATHAALTRQSVRVDDPYRMGEIGFDGPQDFDQSNCYRTHSLLAVPLIGSEDSVIGVLQIINARDPASGEFSRFGADQQRLVEALSTLAAAALEAHAREKRLRIEIHQLHVQIDEARRERDVKAITDSDYFHDLQQRVRQLRAAVPAT